MISFPAKSMGAYALLIEMAARSVRLKWGTDRTALLNKISSNLYGNPFHQSPNPHS